MSVDFFRANTLQIYKKDFPALLSRLFCLFHLTAALPGSNSARTMQLILFNLAIVYRSRITGNNLTEMEDFF